MACFSKDAAETQAVAAAFADTEDAMRVDGDSSAGSSDEASCQLIRGNTVIRVKYMIGKNRGTYIFLVSILGF